jgi:hypothetical protein
VNRKNEITGARRVAKQHRAVGEHCVKQKKERIFFIKRCFFSLLARRYSGGTPSLMGDPIFFTSISKLSFQQKFGIHKNMGSWDQGGYSVQN